MTEQTEKKKLSLQELVKQQLEAKKNKAGGGNNNLKGDTSTKHCLLYTSPSPRDRG